LEIKQGYTTMHGQPIIKNYNHIRMRKTEALFADVGLVADEAE